MIQSSAKADERREKGRAGGMTLGEGCGVCHQSGKWDLGLVNTHESVWRLWEKHRQLWCLCSEKWGRLEGGEGQQMVIEIREPHSLRDGIN